MKTFDGQFVPFGDGKVERPEPRRLIQERLDDKQIAWVHVMADDPGPTGSPVLGLEFTTGERLTVMAAEDQNSRTWNCRLVFSWMPPQKIWTPAMRQHFGHGRVIELGDPEPGDVERWLEGALVKGIKNIREPTATGGECMLVELTDGRPFSLWLAAEATADPPFTCDLIAQVRRPPTRLVTAA